MIGMDVAASEFLLKDGRYDLDFKTDNNDGSQVMTGTYIYMGVCVRVMTVE